MLFPALPFVSWYTIKMMVVNDDGEGDDDEK